MRILKPWSTDGNFLFFVGSSAKIPAKFSFFPLEIEKCSVQPTGMSWKLGWMVEKWVKYLTWINRGINWGIPKPLILTSNSTSYCWCLKNPIPNHRKWMYSKPFLNNGRYINVPTSTGFLAGSRSSSSLHRRLPSKERETWIILLAFQRSGTHYLTQVGPTDEKIPRKLQPFVDQRWNVPCVFFFFQFFGFQKLAFFLVDVFFWEAGTA